ncbi:rhomboid family intramembrane serine protease [Sphingobacterium psychroaquaticum]|uniref:rhomboid family intramembrane serine protease n=1 Tax=Sphingobacterium psychroaquaticum TaxID=561061 RepID=UPI00106C0A48|nr:rhomboid family intramembrane serine protease [Sphingobacterium psychroaquaticum]QBQ41065.1 rhomboid family intramembrane serine protease [Sphingobacterium psychroaquaticum]
MSIFDVLPTFQESPWTYIIVPLIFVSSIIGFYYKPYFYKLVLHPYEVCRGKRWHTLLTSAFVHRNWWHLLFNLLAIYVLTYDAYECVKQIYGKNVSICLSPIIYIVLITIPNILQTLRKKENFLFTTMGASGLSFGLYGFSGLFFPTETVSSFVLPFVGNFFFNWLSLLLILFLLTRVRKTTSQNVYLHLYAFLFGGLLAFIVRPNSFKEVLSLFI